MRLAEYMVSEGLNLTRLAERLSRPISTVHGWLAGHRRPDWEALEHIHRVTKGSVTPNDFLHPIAPDQEAA